MRDQRQPLSEMSDPEKGVRMLNANARSVYVHVSGRCLKPRNLFWYQGHSTRLKESRILHLRLGTSEPRRQVVIRQKGGGQASRRWLSVLFRVDLRGFECRVY